MSKPSGETVQDFMSMLPPIESVNPVRERNVAIAERHKALLDEIKEQAHAEAWNEAYAKALEEGRADGLQKGYEEGFSQGRKEAMALKSAELTRLTDDLNRLSGKVEAALAKWYADAEPQLAKLSMLIATRIVAKELSVSNDSILAMTREALAEVTHAEEARIKVNPIDADVLEEHRADLMSIAPSLKQMHIVEDRHIPGGCVIETDGGVIESRLDAKLKEIWADLRRAA